MKREYKWIKYEFESFRPCINYVPTRMRMLSETRQKHNWQVYVPAGDRWRGWERIRWSDERSSNNWPSSRTHWRRMTKTGRDHQVRGLKTIDQVHVHSRDGWRRWDGIISWEVIKKLTKFTYFLETDEEDGMGWSDESSSNNWPSSRTHWRQMKRMGWYDQIIRLQMTKFTYRLVMEEEDRMVWSDERSSNNWPSSRTVWRPMKRMGWDDQMRGRTNWRRTKGMG